MSHLNQFCEKMFMKFKTGITNSFLNKIHLNEVIANMSVVGILKRLKRQTKPEWQKNRRKPRQQ